MHAVSIRWCSYADRKVTANRRVLRGTRCSTDIHMYIHCFRFIIANVIKWPKVVEFGNLVEFPRLLTWYWWWIGSVSPRTGTGLLRGESTFGGCC